MRGFLEGRWPALDMLDAATHEAWAILRDEVAVDPVREKVRAVVDDNLTNEDRVSQLRGVLDEDQINWIKEEKR